ncbi:MAG TPA: GntR family transcriptional regulator [Steroidobacteraceae bacterium]|nr:GntR family transcriptional regulator [Steroidobacteraceae bacterium]
MYTTRAVEKAYLMIRDRIVRGVYAPGLRVTEQEIANATGVSRTPVREALRRLQADGFVQVTPNAGAVVTKWTENNMRDVFELRAILESYGAQRAAERITPAGIVELKKLAEQQYEESVRQAPGYIERIGEVNSRFHRSLQEFSGNARLVAMLPALIEAPLVLKTFSRYEHSDLVRSASHHLEIVSALEARNGEWAASVMRSHILAAQAAFRQDEIVDAVPTSQAG